MPLLSKKLKLIFSHIPKTAGASFNVAVGAVDPNCDWPGEYHSLATREFCSWWPDYHRVTIIRNSYDIVVSRYRHRFLVGLEEGVKPKYTFKEWILTDDDPDVFNQHKYVYDDKGLIQDQIIRYDKLEEGIVELNKILNQKQPGLNVNIKLSEKRSHEFGYYNPKDFYTDQETIDIVSEKCKKDIELFNFRYEPEKKLHLGCGWRNFGKDWIHIDDGDYSHLDVKCNIAKLNLPSNYADLIYASHVIAYFDRNEIKDVLLEWHRVLKPNGILRLATPDFMAMSYLYNRGEIPLGKILGPMYGKMPMDKSTIYHKTTYDFHSLEEILVSCGFKNVNRYDWKETDHSQFDDHSQAYIPHMDKENGTLISLNVECIK